jgi:AcrR family transcriptional regulator
MRDASATRRKIHDAALTLFVAKGVDATTTRDLAQAAGIAEGTLYRHYISKDALVQDLFLSNYQAFGRRLQALQSTNGDFAARLEAVVADVCAFYDDDPLLFRFLLLEQHRALPKAPAQDNPVEILQQMIAAAIARGEIPPQPAGLATAMVLGLMLQPAVALVYGRIGPPFSQYSAGIFQACRRVLDP